MSDLADQLMVPEDLQGKVRSPFILLVDVSASTGQGTDPDINHINNCLNILVDNIRNPASNSELFHYADTIDTAIVAYSTDVEIIFPWRINTDLPPSVPRLVPKEYTHTAKAFDTTFNLINALWDTYENTGISSNMPQIFHLTDGALNDAVPGDDTWNNLQRRLKTATSSGSNERSPKLAIHHFITPNGYKRENDPTTGQLLASGQDLLISLCETDKFVYELGHGVDQFMKLVKFIAVSMGTLSSTGNAAESIDRAKKAAGLKAVGDL